MPGEWLGFIAAPPKSLTNSRASWDLFPWPRTTFCKSLIRSPNRRYAPHRIKTGELTVIPSHITDAEFCRDFQPPRALTKSMSC
jgi:hypothetical protein